tara:strand:+ start:369 stop:1169 length:801 start_codon:yes stop_codon:yes gene_type:complete
MIEKDSEWILPENLKKQEKKSRELIDQGKGNTDHGGFFGAYYAYRKGVNFDYIKSHAFSDDQKAIIYVKHITYILQKYDLKIEGNVIDIGCAIGAISNGINILNKNGKTYGLDISEDGIEVAKKKYPNCIFFNQSADNLDNFDNEYFDVIHAKEFYPFTRTNDIQYHLKYLKLFYSKLKQHGFVVLQMISLNKGFSNTYQKLSKDLSDIGYAPIRVNTMIPLRVITLLGELSYGKFFYPILQLICKILIVFNKRSQLCYLYILTKK